MINNKNQKETQIEVVMNVDIRNENYLKDLDKVSEKIEQMEKEHNSHCTLFKININ